MWAGQLMFAEEILLIKSSLRVVLTQILLLPRAERMATHSDLLGKEKGGNQKLIEKPWCTGVSALPT
jgi:hypothetical protein